MTKSEFIKTFPKLYYSLRHHKQLDMLNNILGCSGKRQKILPEEIFNSVKKYKTLNKWKSNNSGYYQAACRLGILKEVTKNLARRIDHGKWTKSSILEAMSRCKNTTEFMRTCGGAYDASIRKNLLIKNRHLFKEYTQVSGKYDTLDKVLKIAKLYKTVVEWKSCNAASYAAARRKRWLDKCKEHLTCGRRISSKTKKVLRSDGKVYISISAARRDGFTGVSAALKDSKVTCKGYRFAYCDANGKILTNGGKL